MTLRLAIIADDLTGALDAAAPFAARGLRVEVALSPDTVAAAVASEAEVVAVNTRSREVAPELARAAAAQALAALPETALFKKIDSRMKGNIAAELSAFGYSRALIAPAIPAFGRMVRGGHVVGFGVDSPIAITLPGIVPDTVTNADLDAALAAHPDALPVGARGLAEALARRMTGAAPRPAPLAGPNGLFVIGSRDAITLAQVAASGLPVTPAPNGIASAAPQGIAILQATPGTAPIPPTEVAANLARSIRTPDGTLFITGGATAEAILSALGLTTLRLLGEAMPGLPVARAGDLTVVTKSGGFGDPQTLASLAQMIRAAT